MIATVRIAEDGRTTSLDLDDRLPATLHDGDQLAVDQLYSQQPQQLLITLAALPPPPGAGQPPSSTTVPAAPPRL